MGGLDREDVEVLERLEEVDSIVVLGEESGMVRVDGEGLCVCNFFMILRFILLFLLFFLYVSWGLELIRLFWGSVVKFRCDDVYRYVLEI